MFNPIEGGSTVEIQGLKCHIPPVGYIVNDKGELEFIGVYKRSDIPEEQYWERMLPSWYPQLAIEEDKFEKRKKKDDSVFYDERYEAFKEQEWKRRLFGFWFMNKGIPTYVVGIHYLYLQWWPIDIGFVKFRKPDLWYFYFMQYVIEDPMCMGFLEITKRRFGKSFRAGLFIMEYITRTRNAVGAIQSKTGKDAKKFFTKTVVKCFRRMPRFFRPIYDTSLGINPKTEMRFERPNVRGEKAEDNRNEDELGSMVDHESADPMAYDGQKIHRGVNDEFAKCFAKGTRIRMYDGSVKNVEDVYYGDMVMGDDSTPRIAGGITKGVEEMYEIIPNKGSGFTCNASHILTLSVSDRFTYKKVKYKVGDIIEITVKEYLEELPKYMYVKLAIYRTGWELKEQKHLIDPYMLGVWLGDGRSTDFSITSIDHEVIDSVNEFAKHHGLHVRVKDDKISYHVTSKTIGVNHITGELRRLGILKNKHIPGEYLKDSRENRLQLLAGLIDTDGYSICRNGFCCGVEITQKRKDLAYNIHELATSLGFYASIREQISTMKRKDGTIYRCPTHKIIFYGDIDLIPNRVERKKAIISRTKNRRNPLKSGFEIKSVGIGEYYGFTVDRNNLFLLEDGTVVHNTTEANIYDRHEVLRFCVLDDEKKIIGKLLYTSTAEKLDSDKDGVQEAAKTLWDESNQLEKSENGMTASGLYRFFLSADFAKNIDKYGDPDVEKTIKEIEADRANAKSKRALLARIRKEPRTIEEAFMDDDETCIFNTMNINAQKAYLRDHPVKKRAIQYYRDLDQTVKFRDVDPDKTELCWQTIWLPKEEDKNKYFYDGSFRKPKRTDVGVIGVDGYSNTQGGKVYGSKLSGWMFLKYDIRDPENTGLFAAHIYGRANDKDDMYEQILLAAEYNGFRVWFEFASDDYYGYFKDRGRLGYLGNFPRNSIAPDKLKKDKTERPKGFPTTDFALTKQNDAMVMYVDNHCQKIFFEVLLDDLPKFKPYKRTPSDVTVSAMITLVCSMELSYERPKRRHPLVRVYQNESYKPPANENSGRMPSIYKN